MSFEKLEPKQAREVISVDSKEDLINLNPEKLKRMIEKLSDPELPPDKFEHLAQLFNQAEDMPPREVKRYSLTLENGRVIEVCVDDEGRIGLNYKL